MFGNKKKTTLDKGIETSKKSFFEKLNRVMRGKSIVNAQILDELEEILITSDVGIETTIKIIEQIEKRVAHEKYLNTKELNQLLKEEIMKLIANPNEGTLPANETQVSPYVILVVGVNGVGKTTTIGKLANRYKERGKTVILGAADTFRAAAVQQLILWGERIQIPVVSKGTQADPAAVAFEVTQVGKEKKADVIIIDTAGRLHTKKNLMNELTKIKKVVNKNIPDAPHEVMLVLDGSTGQNAFIQAKEFSKATQVNSLTITKLDGTAKGGVLIGISDQFNIPVKYIGVGEKQTDLLEFDKVKFVNSFFNN